MIKVGIIGCGSIARQRHAYEYYNNPNAQLMGVYDFDSGRAEALARDFDTKVYASAGDVFADPEIQAVSICAANAYHAQLTVQALDAGKHVLCEKPMAVTLEDCQAMVDAAQRNGRRLLIDQNQRLASAHVKARALLASGELGRVISFSTTFGHKGPEMWSADKSANTWFFKKDVAAFGSMADLGIHKIDLMRYLLGARVKSVYADFRTLDKKFPDGKPIEVDDNSVELLVFEGGAMGTVTTSWTHYAEECNATVLYCEKGTVRIYDDPKYTLIVNYADGTRTLYELDAMQTNDDAQQKSSGVIDEFISCLETGAASVLDATSVIDSMRVVFACIESASSHRMVDIVN